MYKLQLKAQVCLLSHLNHAWCQYILMPQNMLRAGGSSTKKAGLSDDFSDVC